MEAGAPLSSSVAMLINKLASSNFFNFASGEGLTDDLKKLNSMLNEIRVLLDGTEEKTNNRFVNKWLSELRDWAYDIEDIVDKFETEAYFRRHSDVDSQGSSSKIRNRFRNSPPRFITSNVEMVSTIKHLSTRLEKIIKQKDDLNLREILASFNWLSDKTEKKYMRPNIQTENEEENIIENEENSIEDEEQNIIHFCELDLDITENEEENIIENEEEYISEDEEQNIIHNQILMLNLDITENEEENITENEEEYISEDEEQNIIANELLEIDTVQSENEEENITENEEEYIIENLASHDQIELSGHPLPATEHAIGIVQIGANNETYQRENGCIHKICVGRIFFIINFLIELPSAAFDQLYSVHKPLYARLSMVLSLVALVICVAELLYKALKERVVWRCRSWIAWLSFADIVALICAASQSIITTINYIFTAHHVDSPIKISAAPIIYALALLVSKFRESPNRDTPNNAE